MITPDPFQWLCVTFRLIDDHDNDSALPSPPQNNLTELKAFGSPPAAVVNVMGAVMCMLAPGGKVPKDRSWKNCKASIMSKVKASGPQYHAMK